MQANLEYSYGVDTTGLSRAQRQLEELKLEARSIARPGASAREAQRRIRRARNNMFRSARAPNASTKEVAGVKRRAPCNDDDNAVDPDDASKRARLDNKHSDGNAAAAVAATSSVPLPAAASAAAAVAAVDSSPAPAPAAAAAAAAPADSVEHPASEKQWFSKWLGSLPESEMRRIYSVIQRERAIVIDDTPPPSPVSASRSVSPGNVHSAAAAAAAAAATVPRKSVSFSDDVDVVAVPAAPAPAVDDASTDDEGLDWANVVMLNVEEADLPPAVLRRKHSAVAAAAAAAAAAASVDSKHRDHDSDTLTDEEEWVNSTNPRREAPPATDRRKRIVAAAAAAAAADSKPANAAAADTDSALIGEENENTFRVEIIKDNTKPNSWPHHMMEFHGHSMLTYELVKDGETLSYHSCRASDLPSLIVDLIPGTTIQRVKLGSAAMTFRDIHIHVLSVNAPCYALLYRKGYEKQIPAYLLEADRELCADTVTQQVPWRQEAWINKVKGATNQIHTSRMLARLVRLGFAVVSYTGVMSGPCYPAPMPVFGRRPSSPVVYAAASVEPVSP